MPILRGQGIRASPNLYVPSLRYDGLLPRRRAQLHIRSFRRPSDSQAGVEKVQDCAPETCEWGRVRRNRLSRARQSRQPVLVRTLVRVHDDGEADPGPIPLSEGCVGWARTAGYVTAVADDGEIQLRSQVGAPTRYCIRRRGPDRLELTQADDGGEKYPLLFVAAVEVLERYLVGLFGEDIREDLDLPFLDLPSDSHSVAPGYALSDMVRDYRTLTRSGHGPVAAAPDPALSLLALVPLSHLLGWPIPDLKRAFLNPTGGPLMRDGQYAPAPM